MQLNVKRVTCQGYTVAGEPCGSPIIGEDGYCDAHSPDPDRGLEVVRERAHKGGEITKELYRAGLADLPPLDSPAVAQEWLERIARALTLGRLTSGAGNAAIRAVSEWLKAHEATETARRIEGLEERVEELRQAGVL